MLSLQTWLAGFFWKKNVFDLTAVSNNWVDTCIENHGRQALLILWGQCHGCWWPGNKGTRASAATTLTQFSWNIPESAPERLRVFLMYVSILIEGQRPVSLNFCQLLGKKKTQVFWHTQSISYVFFLWVWILIFDLSKKKWSINSIQKISGINDFCFIEEFSLFFWMICAYLFVETVACCIQ